MTNEPTAPLSPEQIDEVIPGLFREWFYDKHIVVYRLTTVSQTIVNHWADLTLEMLNAWDKTRPYLALHDLSNPGVSLQYATLVGFDIMNIGITMQGRTNAEDVFNAHPNFLARVAIGFNLSVSGQVSQVVMDRIKTKHPSIQYKTFFNREKSFAWLVQNLKAETNS